MIDTAVIKIHNNINSTATCTSSYVCVLVVDLWLLPSIHVCMSVSSEVLFVAKRHDKAEHCLHCLLHSLFNLGHVVAGKNPLGHGNRQARTKRQNLTCAHALTRAAQSSAVDRVWSRASIPTHRPDALKSTAAVFVAQSGVLLLVRCAAERFARTSSVGRLGIGDNTAILPAQSTLVDVPGLAVPVAAITVSTIMLLP